MNNISDAEIRMLCRWLGANMRRLAREKLLLQKDIAVLAGINRPAITLMMSGENFHKRDVTCKMRRVLVYLLKLCKAFDCQPEELLREPASLAILAQDGRTTHHEQKRRMKRLQEAATRRRNMTDAELALCELKREMGFDDDA